MKFLDDIKSKLGKRKIEKILKNQKRKIKVSSFATAHSSGIVQPVTTTDYQDIVSKYVDFLREEIGFKKIVALGYCNQKELPSVINKETIKDRFLTTSELNFTHFGTNKETQDFLKQDFDLLIDLSREYCTPIKHIVASSRAGFKIGRHSEENEKYYDFMVEIKKNAPVSRFIKQVNTFLTQVNPK